MLIMLRVSRMVIVGKKDMVDRGQAQRGAERLSEDKK
jgi:hypothetical protein